MGTKLFLHNMFETFSIKQAISGEIVDPVCSDGHETQRCQTEKLKS